MRINLIDCQEIPKRIENKLHDIEKQIRGIINSIQQIQITNLGTDHIIFRFEQNADYDILDSHEHTQLLCFSMKFSQLPQLEKIEVTKNNGEYQLANLDHIRHVINDHRSVISNKKDPIYYNTIHAFCRKKLMNRDPSKGLVVRVFDVQDNEITETYIKYLDESCKSIRYIIDKSDFDYLYNGILQHAEPRHTERYRVDYTSGELNYLFIKHAILLGCFKRIMFPHYLLIKELRLPTLGYL